MKIFLKINVRLLNLAQLAICNQVFTDFSSIIAIILSEHLIL